MGQPNQPNVPPPDQPPPQQYDADQVWDIVADVVRWAIAAFTQGVKQQELAAQIPHLIPPPPAMNNPLEISKSFVSKPKDYDGDKIKFHSWWRSIMLYLGGFQTEPSDQQKIMMVHSWGRKRNRERKGFFCRGTVNTLSVPPVCNHNQYACLPYDENEVEPLKFKRMGKESRRLTKGSIDSAGYDLYSAEEAEILPRKWKVVDTQIAIKVPKGTYGCIASRSGLVAKHGIDVRAGVIDANYWGEVKVLLVNHSNVMFSVKKRDRMAQLVLEKISLVELNEVSELDEIQRRQKGFGSTGMNENEEKKQKKEKKEVWFEESEPEHKGVQGKILPKRVDTWTRNSRTWSNTVDPWTCRWIKKMIDQKDKKHAIKHVRSFVHESRIEQVNPQLVQQLKSLTDNEA